jgi:hypothetical protein
VYYYVFASSRAATILDHGKQVVEAIFHYPHYQSVSSQAATIFGGAGC